MEQDFKRLQNLRSELGALRQICQSEFVLRSIDEVIGEIKVRQDKLDNIKQSLAGDFAPDLKPAL